MTIAIASFQRRGTLMRLLRALDAQLATDEDLARDLDVLVVLDGSTDGSQAAVENAPWTVPVRVHWQPNQGLATARNVGLDAAKGRLVWFLDDDLVPSVGLVARHRGAHAGEPGVFVGPCRIPDDVDAPEAVVRWWDEFHADLERKGVVDQLDRFTTANASAPADLLSAVGGFDASFVEYGLEDYELAVRVLREGIGIRFDSDAIAWHPDIPPMRVLVARQYGLGLNAALLAGLHPETVESLFPIGEVSRPRRFLRNSRLRSPRSLMAVSRVALTACRATSRFGGGFGRRSELLSRAAAHAAGVAEGDPSGALLDRVLGYSAATPRD
jgi:glycosyltransferase involved in cell wall biosynthesis